MRNKIIKISEFELNTIISNSDNEIFAVILDGEKINDSKSFFEQIGKAFDFKISDGIWGRNWSAFDDMMTDLNWLNYNKIRLFIKSYNYFLSGETNAKKDLLTTSKTVFCLFGKKRY